MKSLISILHSKFNQATQKAFPELSTEMGEIPIELTTSTQDKFGHYQFNSAMKLTKVLKQPPRKIAELIVAALNCRTWIYQYHPRRPFFI